MTLGQTVRNARVGKGLTGRELARRLGVTPSYLHDIEHDRRVPAAGTMRALATHLDVGYDALMALGGRLDPEVADYLRRTPLAGFLLRRLALHGLGDAELTQLLEAARRLAEDDMRERLAGG